MAIWLIRRLIQALFVVIAMSVIVFIGVHVIGNPVDILISPEADQAERARAPWGSSLSSRPARINRYGSSIGCSSSMHCTATWAAVSCSMSQHYD